MPLEEAASGGRETSSVVWTPLVPGYRGRPTRSCLVCVERGNPVGVRAVRSGRPIVRGAELLGGNRMPNKRMPMAERRRDSRPNDRCSGGGRGEPVGYQPDGWARKGADVGR